MRKLLFVCAAAGSAALLNGCATSGGMSKADKSFARGEYEPAIEMYKADVAKGKNAAMSNYRIGEAYRLSNRAGMAEEYYKAALDGGVKNADAGYRYAEALKSNGKFDEAAAQFSSYAQSGGNRTLAARAEAEAKNATASKAVAGMVSRYDVMALDTLNSAGSDYGAAMMPGTGELVFASGRDGKKYLGNGENFQDLYAVKFTDPTAMTGGAPRKLEGPFNTEDAHEASATYSPDGKTMVFARGNNGKKNNYKSADGTKTTLQSVDLWVSYNKGGTWTEPALANINDRTADDFAPVFAPDGTLYFASGRKSGLGGNDLYKATLGPNGRFSPAENLGESINTVGNDNFPGVAPDGTLYFSSDGHPGFGKLDIFMVKNGKVTNLGADVNSMADDFAPLPVNGEMGVFSSNRAGGKGSDDLYKFTKKPKKMVTFYADGTVLERDVKAGTTAPAAGAVVTIIKNGQRQTVTAGPDGKFTAKLDTMSNYSLKAEIPGAVPAGYFRLNANGSLSTIGRVPSQEQLPQVMNDINLPVTLTIEKRAKAVAIEIRDILYDYNKYDIRPDAALRLDTLVQTLVDNPRISIELSSHTDSRGKDAYNLKLSQQRAQAAVDYIASKGIAKSRMTAKGYGETKPKIKNAKTEEEFQKNRRTEFTVTRVAN